MTERSLRRLTEAFGSRLERIAADGTAVRELATAIDQGLPPAVLVELLDVVERDLLLATYELDFVRERATGALASRKQWRPSNPAAARRPLPSSCPPCRRTSVQAR